MKFALTCLLTLIAVVTSDSIALAKSYAVSTCGASNSIGDFVAMNSHPDKLSTNVQCPPLPSHEVSGISITTANTNSLRGDGAAWRIAAPQGTRISTVGLQRALGKRDPGWDVAIRADDATLETCDFELGQTDHCSLGDQYGSQFVTFRGLSASKISFTIDCVQTRFACAGWSSPPEAWIAVYSADVIVEDPDPPAVAPLSAALLGPGWHSGTERVEVAASDASGVGTVSLTAGGVTFGAQEQSCDYSRMQPCPSSLRATIPIDTSKVPDGTYDLVATATDAARQPGTASGVLRVDRGAPAAPSQLTIARNPDGTYALSWTNPNQGTAAPIVAARLQVCEATGCGETTIRSGRDINQISSIALPAGERTIKVWLEDEAGHTEQANAVALTVDPSTVEAPGVLETRPPVLLPTGLAPSSRLRVTRARRSGAILTLSGTIARTATAAIRADASRGKGTAPLAGARTKPKKGRWSVRVRLTPGLRHASTFYVNVVFAGQQTFRKTTLHRRLSKKPPRRGSTATEFSVESGSAPRR